LLIIDVSAFRPSWQTLLVNRILGSLSGAVAGDFKHRIVFQTPEDPQHAVHIMQLGHVLLDPFPVTGTANITSQDAWAVNPVAACLKPKIEHVDQKDLEANLYFYVNSSFTPVRFK
jgi:hypothetical protein